MFTVRERIVHKVKKIAIPLYAECNKKKINNTDFTVISNNCWGGILYENFALPKNSPTVGSYFFADDYIKLLYNLKHYFSLELNIINARESSHYETLKEINQLDIPIGKLGDVEVVMLHYRDPSVAKDKWMRRVDRINWENLILKFSYMSKCTDDHITKFQSIHGVKKFCFVPKTFDNMEDLYYFPSCIQSMTDIGNDTFYWNKYIDVFDLINRTPTGIDKLYFGKPKSKDK